MIITRSEAGVALVSAAVWLVAASTAPAQTPSGSPASAAGGAEETRVAFLRVIDRPRVPLGLESRALPDPAPGISAQHVTFAADARERVPTLVVKSQSASGRRPAVIVLHGTNGRKEGMASRLIDLARRGFVAIAIDGRYHGERMGEVPGPGTSYVNAILRAFESQEEHPFLYDSVWDVMRLIDYLVTRDDVDPSRIALMGFSKGGMETYLAAAVDPRIAAAVPIRGVQSFGWGLDHNGWDSRAWTFREAVDHAARSSGMPTGASFLRRFYDAVAPGLYGQFDGPAMLPLIAPRPLLVINGDSDPRTPMAGVRLAARAAEEAYTRLNAADRFRLHIMEDTGHEDRPDIEPLIVEWLERWLAP